MVQLGSGGIVRNLVKKNSSIFTFGKVGLFKLSQASPYAFIPTQLMKLTRESQIRYAKEENISDNGY